MRIEESKNGRKINAQLIRQPMSPTAGDQVKSAHKRSLRLSTVVFQFHSTSFDSIPIGMTRLQQVVACQSFGDKRRFY